MIRRTLCLLLACTIAATTNAQTGKNAAEMKRLVTFLEGQFTSLPQSRDDTTIVPTLWRIDRIWYDRSDGAWLLWRTFPYDHDSTPASEPTKVCIIQVHEIEHGLIEQVLWDVGSPSMVSAFDRDSTVVESLRNREAVSKRRGCEIIHQIGADFYLGRTVGMACPPPEGIDATAEMSTWRVRPMWIELLTQAINSVGEVVAGRKSKPIYFMRTDDARSGRQ